MAFDPNNPYFAMAMQAAQNLGNMRMGRPTVSPIQAYQQSVAANAQLQQQAQQDKLRQLQLQKAEQDLDPFSDYRAALEQGLVSPDTTLGEFQNMADSASKRPVKTFIGENGNVWIVTATGQVQDTGAKGSPPGRKIVDRGGVSYVEETLPGGETRFTPLDQFQQQYRQGQLAAEAGAAESGKQGAQWTMENVQQSVAGLDAERKAFDVAQRMYNVSQEYYEMIDSGKLNTGRVQELLYNILGVGTPELAQMSADQTETLLGNLQIVNLAPVTQQELKEVLQLWAQIGRQEEPNKGLLERAMKRSQQLMEKSMQQSRVQADRLREYSPTEFERVKRYSPWMQGLFEDDDAGEIPGR